MGETQEGHDLSCPYEDGPTRGESFGQTQGKQARPYKGERINC
jgi:hypothetical protein